jgi:hypothetical protein
MGAFVLFGSTRFTRAGDRRARRPRGEIAARSAAVTFAMEAPTFSTQDTTQLKRAIDMTDDELAAIIQGAKLTVVK